MGCSQCEKRNGWNPCVTCKTGYKNIMGFCVAEKDTYTCHAGPITIGSGTGKIRMDIATCNLCYDDPR